MRSPVSLVQLFWSFFKLGFTAFGGYTALVAMIEKDLVDERGWLQKDDIYNGLSIASVLPGPLAVNVVCYIGNFLKGSIGAIVSVVAILTPAFGMMVIAAAIPMDNYMEPIEAMIDGAIPVIAGIIFSVSFKSIRNQIKEPWHYVLFGFALLLIIIFPGYLSLVVSIIVGAIVGLLNKTANAESIVKVSLKWQYVVLLAVLSAGIGVLELVTTSILYDLFMGFAKISLTLFGGGYVMIPALRELTITTNSWITGAEFGRAIALGQMTPGPILVSATYIGFKVAGFAGAIVATLGIFLPASSLMLFISKVFEGVQNSEYVKSALSGVRISVIALILYSGYILMEPNGFNLMPISIALISFCLIAFRNVNFFWLMLGSGVLHGLLYAYG